MNMKLGEQPLFHFLKVLPTFDSSALKKYCMMSKNSLSMFIEIKEPIEFRLKYCEILNLSSILR